MSVSGGAEISQGHLKDVCDDNLPLLTTRVCSCVCSVAKTRIGSHELVMACFPFVEGMFSCSNVSLGVADSLSQGHLKDVCEDSPPLQMTKVCTLVFSARFRGNHGLVMVCFPFVGEMVWCSNVSAGVADSLSQEHLKDVCDDSPPQLTTKVGSSVCSVARTCIWCHKFVPNFSPFYGEMFPYSNVSLTGVALNCSQGHLKDVCENSPPLKTELKMVDLCAWKASDLG